MMRLNTDADAGDSADTCPDSDAGDSADTESDAGDSADTDADAGDSTDTCPDSDAGDSADTESDAGDAPVASTVVEREPAAVEPGSLAASAGGSTGASDGSVEASEGGSEDRVLTIPNLISAGRLACVPWFLWLLFGVQDRWGAALLWGMLGITDWVDGWWARRFNSVSKLGKLLDPISDRAVLLVGLVSIVVEGSVPWWLVAAALFREAMVALVGLVLLSMGASRIDVTWWGKCSTFGLYLAFPSLLAGASDIAVADGFLVVGWVFAGPSLIISYLSAFQYIPLGRASLRERRSRDS